MNKIALVTGATSGIGKATAERLAKLKINLIITGRRNDRLEKIANQLKEKHQIDVLTLCFDVRNYDEVVKAYESLPESWKNIDILVNNAGLALGVSPIHEGSINEWETMIDTNVKGLLYISRIITPKMVERCSGHIVNIGSIAGKLVYPNGNVYCGSKHAVDAISKGMRQDLLKYGIKVTAINPGMVETEFSLVRLNGNAEAAKKVYDGLIPLYAEDIADAVIYAVTRPAHVNINDMIITPTAQADVSNVVRK